MPNTREKLIELLKEVVAIQECGFGDPRPTYETVARYLIAHGVTVQDGEDNNVPTKWISVKDRLPEGDKVVLCYKADRGIRFGKLLDATYANGVQAFMDRDRCFAFGVTHWMPMPQPPKGE